VFIGEAIRFAWDALRANRVRSALTALGMIIGTASVILVVTIAMTGRDYILGQIEGVGSNLIYAYYEAGDNPGRGSLADFLTLEDGEAVRAEVGEIRAVAPIVIQYDRLTVDHGERDVAIIGSNLDYRMIRNLKIAYGRYFDRDDLEQRNKVCLITEPLARKMFGGLEASVGQKVKVRGLQFIVLGTFREGVETFGQSEIRNETLLIPVSVMKYFSPTSKVDQLYFTVHQPSQVIPATQKIRAVLASRHRPGSIYRVENLAEILRAANRIGIALTVVLILISAVTLVISGLGIMNIMLVTVTERTREIGIKKAIGARRHEILLQFLTESVFMSVSGGFLGILVGVSIPLLVRVFVEELVIPISLVSIAVAFAVSCLVGVVFGVVPANRAASLAPTEALRYE
jgi:putative ABC transport system permease protein